MATYVSSTLVGRISLGSPPQPFSTVLVDTGSRIFWIRSSKCASKDCLNQPAFDNAKSSTYTLVTPSVRRSIVYGDGTMVNCSINQDVMTFGTQVLQKVQICEADVITSSTASLDGLIGVGPPGNSDAGVADVFSALLSQSTQSANQSLVSFWYNTNLTIFDNDAGVITLGGLDSEKFTGNFAFFPIESARQYWSLSLAQIRFSDGTLLKISQKNLIVDSGTTIALLPDDMAQSLNLKIGAQFVQSFGGYVLDCDAKKIPAITFAFDGSTDALTLSGRQLYYTDVKSGACISIFQSSGDSSTAILGAWFLRNFYVSFDYGQARIGFAQPTGQLSSNTSVVINGFANNNVPGTGVSTTLLLSILVPVAIVGLLILYCCMKQRRKAAAGPGMSMPPSYPASYQANGYPGQQYPPQQFSQQQYPQQYPQQFNQSYQQQQNHPHYQNNVVSVPPFQST